MWIRSQNKQVLMKVNKIDYVGEAGILGHDEGNETFTILGEYSTEEKALKVLDMIEDRICYLETIMSISRGENFVFQMPQDSEV